MVSQIQIISFPRNSVIRYNEFFPLQDLLFLSFALLTV